MLVVEKDKALTARQSKECTHLPDILVPDSANLLNVCRALGDGLERVAGQDQLVLLRLGDLNVDARLHDHPPHNLLANKVANLDLVQTGLVVLVQVDVDGEMGVHIAHLVLEALGHANDQVVDQRPDRAESGDILAAAVVDLDLDNVLFRQGEVDGDVAQVLGKLSCKELTAVLCRSFALNRRRAFFLPSLSRHFLCHPRHSMKHKPYLSGLQQ